MRQCAQAQLGEQNMHHASNIMQGLASRHGQTPSPIPRPPEVGPGEAGDDAQKSVEITKRRSGTPRSRDPDWPTKNGTAGTNRMKNNIDQLILVQSLFDPRQSSPQRPSIRGAQPVPPGPIRAAPKISVAPVVRAMNVERKPLQLCQTKSPPSVLPISAPQGKCDNQI